MPAHDGRVDDPGSPEPAAQKTSRRRVALAACGVVVIVGVGVAVISSTGSTTTDSAAASQSTATTQIVRQDLVDTETVDGVLGYSDARAVINRLSGTVTSVPAVGSTVRTNHALYSIDGHAVFLLDGAYPAYRTLQAGLRGKDVLELERNLRSLGLDSEHAMSVDGSWDSGTTAAVKRWQRSKGLTEDGVIPVGRVVFQPGARRIGAIRLSPGESASSGGGSSQDSSASPASYTSGVQKSSVDADSSQRAGDGAEIRMVAVAYTSRLQIAPSSPTTPATTPTTTPGSVAPSATPAPRSSPKPTPAAALPGRGSTGSGPGRSLPSGSASAARSGSAPSGGGQSGAASSGTASQTTVATTVMTTTSSKRIVSVDLEASKQALARVGDRATVSFPDGKDVSGTIAKVGKVAQKKTSSSDSSPPATIKVIIKLGKAHATRLDQAPVDVKLTKDRAKDVLTVPVTALIARRGGEFAVEVHDGAARRLVPVTTGLYTDSYVEISGHGLAAGMSVTDARI